MRYGHKVSIAVRYTARIQSVRPLEVLISPSENGDKDQDSIHCYFIGDKRERDRKSRCADIGPVNLPLRYLLISYFSINSPDGTGRHKSEC